MGQQGSKSSVEARALFHRVGAPDKRNSVYQKRNPSCAPVSNIRLHKKMTGPSAFPRSTGRELGKTRPHSWHHSRRDNGALVYVMDNPTGGVWVKPTETRS